MLMPIDNACRETKELSGFWAYRFDRDETGRRQGWFEGFDPSGELPVPASWNELFTDPDDFNFLGTCWYQRRPFVPAAWGRRRVWLRIGAVGCRAEVWINGRAVGSYEGSHLPFEFDVTDAIRPGEANLLVIAVNAELGPHTLPVGNVRGDEDHSTLLRPFPNVGFDFYPYGGIHRPVVLYTTGAARIDAIRVTTDLDGAAGVVRAEIDVDGDADAVTATLDGVTASAQVADGTAAITFRVDDAKRWSPASPHLYEMDLALTRDGETVDAYTQTVGIRTVEVTDTQILLNGEPLELKGFGKHEDFAILGKGLNHAVIKKDFELMRWIGANSFRTTHYPYAEEILDMADRQGVLVISEPPAVGLGFGGDMTELLARHKTVIDEWIARDRNHPSVILWNLANEPRSNKPEAVPYFEDLIAHTRRLDTTRPLTIVTCDGPWIGRDKCLLMGLCDVICINRYYGWYMGHGRIEASVAAMSEELDAIHAEYGRPVIVTEFGADCVEGQHSLPSFVFSEEYQAELIDATLAMLAEKPYVAGAHVWNFADFLTGQVHTRVVGNRKGVFTRARQPKLAAHMLRRRWTDGRL